MPELDTKTRGTPGWWLVRLEKKLTERTRHYDLLERYYKGDHPLPEGDERMREVFRRFQKKSRTNYMKLVADSVSERLEVIGFRTGGSNTDKNDDDAWQIWQANHLDSDSAMAHTAAGKFSDAYVIIGPPDDDGDDEEDGPSPIITVEDPRQVIVETDPVNRRVVRAAAKIWSDDCDDKRHAVVYLPDGFYYFEAPTRPEHNTTLTSPGNSIPAQPSDWEPEEVDDEGIDEDHSFDSDPDDTLVGSRLPNEIAPTVPVVRFVTNPDLAGDGMGEFEDVIDVQDRINNTVMDRLIITKMQAYRQRWVKGIQTEDEDGNELPLPFIPGVDLLWAVEDENAQFGDFAQSDLKPLLEAVKADVQAIVTLTGLPPHYVQGDIVNASADALAAAESRLVSKCRARARGYGESWEQVMRIAFTYLDKPERIGVDAAVIWQDPERQSIAQLADAATKKQSAGVPWYQRMVDMKYKPDEIQRMEADRASDAVLAAAMAPPPVAAPPVTPPAPGPVPVPPEPVTNGG